MPAERCRGFEILRCWAEIRTEAARSCSLRPPKHNFPCSHCLHCSPGRLMGQLCISIPDWPPGSDTASTPSPKILDELRRRACNTVQTLKRSRVTPQGLGVPNQVQDSAVQVSASASPLSVLPPAKGLSPCEVKGVG